MSICKIGHQFMRNVATARATRLIPALARLWSALGSAAAAFLAFATHPTQAASQLQFNVSSMQALENNLEINVSVERTGSFDGKVSVDFASSDDTAKAGEDYVAVSSRLNFNSGESLRYFSVRLINDGLRESTERFTLTLSNPTDGAVLGTRKTSAINIADNDQGITFEKGMFEVSEVSPQATITVQRGVDDISSAFMVEFATSDGSAIDGEDYKSVSGTLNFRPGDTQQSFVVPILNDGTQENFQSLNLRLSNPTSGAFLGLRTNAVLRIADNDPGFSISPGPYDVSETPGEVRLTVYRGTDNPSRVSVDFATSDGSGLAGLDYGATSGTLTFERQESFKTISIPILGDGLVESRESFQITLSNPSPGASLGSPTSATIRITSDDNGIQFNSSSATAWENAGEAHITVVRGNDTSGLVSVEFATADDTAKAGVDYIAASGILKFAGSERTKTIVVPLLNNDRVDGSRQLRIELKKPSGGADLGTRSTAVLAIQDNETGVQFSHGSYSVSEAQGAVRVTVLRGDDGNLPVSVDYTTANGTAIAGVDYQTRSGSLRFMAGEVSKFLLIPISNDGRTGINRTFTLSLTKGGGTIGPWSTQTAEVIIIDNDMGLSFSQSSYVVSETDKSVEITVIRSDDGNSSVSVDYATRDGSGQTAPTHVPQSGTLTFGTGEMAQSFTIPILNNSVANGDSIVQLLLSNPNGGATLGAPSAASLSIVEDDRTVVLDTTFDVGSGADESVSCLSVLPDGRVLVGGHFRSIQGVARTAIARILPNGSVDPAFNPNDGRGGINQGVTCFSVQADESILIGGYFDSINGIPRSRIAKLKPDGTLDDAFVTGEILGVVESLAVQPDGKVIMVGCGFTVGGTLRGPILRLNSDGTLDTTFASPFSPDDGGCLRQVVVLPKGKILVAGEFYLSVPEDDRQGLVRLNADGSLDTEFLAWPGMDYTYARLASTESGMILVSSGDLVRLKGDGSLDKVLLGSPDGHQSQVRGGTEIFAVQMDGKIVAFGNFFGDDSPFESYRMVRLNLDGSPDTQFNENAKIASSWDSVQLVAAQPDGKILIGGRFQTSGAAPHSGIARLNADGTLDTRFNVGIVIEYRNPDSTLSPGSVGYISLQTDGKILVGGEFNSVNGFPRWNAVRLNADGSVDRSFDLGDLATLWWGDLSPTLVENSKGQILITGYLSGIDGQRFVGIARLNSDFTSPAFQFQSQRFAASESQGIAEIRVRRLGNADKPATVEFHAGTDTAVEGVDFSATSGTLTFAPMETFKTFRIPLMDDGDDENDKTVQLTLKNPSANSQLVLAKAMLTIVDDERPGSPDPTFKPGFKADENGFHGSIDLAAVQSDGKTLILGQFTLPDGQPRSLARLNPDGTLDAGFKPLQNHYSSTLIAQPDGKIITRSPSNLVRLMPDGSLDSSFSLDPGVVTWTAPGMALDSNGKVFTLGLRLRTGSNPQYYYTILRLFPDGTVDPSFDDARAAAYGYFNGLVALEDGGVLFWGSWSSTPNANVRSKLIRLKPDGSEDVSFRPSIPANGWTIRKLVVDSDGTILLSGSIWINSTTEKQVVRLFADGSVDSGFEAGSLRDVYSIGVQPNGKILVGGNLHGIDPNQVPTLARLHPDGKVDTTFDPGPGLTRLRGSYGNQPDLSNMQLFVLPDGKALITGGFTQVNELVLPMITRVNGDFEVRITALQWLESGKVRLTSTSRKGKNYALQSSDDLNRWTPLGTTTALGNVLQMEDTPQAGTSQHYYRVVQGN